MEKDFLQSVLNVYVRNMKIQGQLSCLSMKMNYASRLSTGRNSLTGLWMNLDNRENYN